MIKRMSFIVFLSLVGLVGCASGNEIQLSSTNLSTPSSQLPSLTTDTPALSLTTDSTTVEPTQPVPSITYSPEPSVTQTAAEAILPIKHVKQQCIDVQENLPQDFITEGVILLEESGQIFAPQSEDANPSLLQNTPFFLGGERYVVGTRFLYRTEGSKLVIITPNGDLLATLDWDDSLESYSLLDDQQILFRHKGSDPVAEIINPFTGSREMYTLELPDFFDGYPDAHITYWKFVVDPALATTAYMQSTQDSEFPIFVLWDMAENQALWTLDKNSVYFFPPVWSPDLSKLAVVAMNHKEDNWDRFELFLVDVNGNATKWIDLKGIYPDVLITDMKWSPDSRYLAFLAPDNKPFLILDTSTQQLLDHCIPGNSSYGKIVWAPDSTQVIIPRKDAPAVVLDLVSETAAQIIEDSRFTPVGWLAKEP